MKICVFGDSIGKGVILDPSSNRYKSLKLNTLQTAAQYTDISLTNHSVFGCTVSKGLSMIERHADALKDYDHVILEFGGNDCNFLWNEVAAAPTEKHLPKNPPEIFTKTYRESIERLQNMGIKPILLTLPPLHAKRFFDWVSNGLRGENILQWLGGVDMIYRWQEMYSLAVVKLANTFRLPLVDIRSAFLCRHDLPELICRDGMHPTQKGYELIVRTVYEFLTNQGNHPVLQS